MIKRLGLVVFVTIGLGFWFPRKVLATVMVGSVARSGSVIVNYTYNHDYYPREWDYRYQMLADATEQMRKTIFAELKMPQILIVVPDEIFGRTPSVNTIEYKKDCIINYGDVANMSFSGEQKIECFEISLNTHQPSWEGIIKILMSLQNFDRSQKITTQKLEDLVATQNEWYGRLVSFANFKNYYNVGWSPDSQYLSALFWQNGKSGVEILNTDGVVTRFETNDYPAHAPMWIDNGKYLAYTTMNQVIWWSRDTEEFRQAKIDAKYLESLLVYDPLSQTLNIAVDTAVVADYQIFKLNLLTGKLDTSIQKYNFLGWSPDSGIDKMNFPGQLVSVDGSRRMTFENKLGKENDVIRIEDLQLPLVEQSKDIVSKAEVEAQIKSKYFNWRLIVVSGGIFVVGVFVGWFLRKRKVEVYLSGEK